MPTLNDGCVLRVRIDSPPIHTSLRWVRYACGRNRLFDNSRTIHWGEDHKGNCFGELVREQEFNMDKQGSMGLMSFIAEALKAASPEDEEWWN